MFKLIIIKYVFYVYLIKYNINECFASQNVV